MNRYQKYEFYYNVIKYYECFYNTRINKKKLFKLAKRLQGRGYDITSEKVALMVVFNKRLKKIGLGKRSSLCISKYLSNLIYTTVYTDLEVNIEPIKYLSKILNTDKLFIVRETYLKLLFFSINNNKCN